MSVSIEQLEEQIEESKGKIQALKAAIDIACDEREKAYNNYETEKDGINLSDTMNLPRSIDFDKKLNLFAKRYYESNKVVLELEQELKRNQEKLTALQNNLTPELRSPSAKEDPRRLLENQIKYKIGEQNEALMAAEAIKKRMDKNPRPYTTYVIPQEDLKNSIKNKIKELDTKIDTLEKDKLILKAQLNKSSAKQETLNTKEKKLQASIEKTQNDQKRDFFLIRMYRGIFGSPTLKKKQNELNAIVRQSEENMAAIVGKITKIRSTTETITRLKSTRESENNELDKQSHPELTAERNKLIEKAERLGHEIKGLEKEKNELSIKAKSPEKEKISSQDNTLTTKNWKEKLVSTFIGTSSQNESSKENQTPLEKPPTFRR